MAVGEFWLHLTEVWVFDLYESLLRILLIPEQTQMNVRRYLLSVLLNKWTTNTISNCYNYELAHVKHNQSTVFKFKWTIIKEIKCNIFNFYLHSSNIIEHFQGKRKSQVINSLGKCNK